MKLKVRTIFGLYFFLPVAFASTSVSSSDQQSYAYPVGAVGYGNCVATGINDRGQVIGYALRNHSPYSHVRAFLTGPKGLGVIALSLGGQDSYAWGINASGQVVGNASDAGGIFRPYVTDADGENMRVLQLPGIAQSATGINDIGQVVGGITESASITYAYLTGPGAVGLTRLGTLEGGSTSSAIAVNASGQVIGSSNIAGEQYADHAFITGPNGAGLTELGQGGGSINSALSLNDKGQVTGTISLFDGTYRQYITGPNGADLKLLGTLKDIPGSSSEGAGINDLGNTVGASYFPGESKHYPFPVTVTDNAGHMLDLNRLVVNLPKGVTLAAPGGGINRYDQIATHGTDGVCYIVCPNKNCVP